MIERVDRGADVVLASWVMLNVKPLRRLLSSGAGWVVRHSLGVEATTVSSFFRVYRASALRAAHVTYGDRLIREPGFACKAEILAKLARLGAHIEEVPVGPRLHAARGQEQDADLPDDPLLLAHARQGPVRARDRLGMTPSVGIVGGGILGMTAALRLAQSGVRVALYERSEDLGGLVGTFQLGDRRVDRFYHVILPTDDRVIGLAEELGLGDRFRFRPTKVGFYGGGRLFSMTTPKEFLTFPILRARDRVRLAAFVARCQLKKDYADLDDRPLLEWLRRLCGRRVVERLWEPLLDSKFDGCYDDLPATYIWARSRRMSTTRDKGGHEVMGWLEGGYQTLIDALEREIRRLGGEVHAGTAVQHIAGTEEATGLVVDDRFRPFDHVLCTLAPPQARRLLPPRIAVRAPDHCRYLGVDLPRPADAAEHQPLLPPEHHRPERPAHDRRRDHARGRSRPPSAARSSTSRSTSTRAIPTRTSPRRRSRRSTWRSRAGCSPTSPTRTSSTRASSARASPSRCTCSAARSGCRTCSRRPASRSPRRRTCTRRSSAGRP